MSRFEIETPDPSQEEGNKHLFLRLLIKLCLEPLLELLVCAKGAELLRSIHYRFDRCIQLQSASCQHVGTVARDQSTATVVSRQHLHACMSVSLDLIMVRGFKQTEAGHDCSGTHKMLGFAADLKMFV